MEIKMEPIYLVKIHETYSKHSFTVQNSPIKFPSKNQILQNVSKARGVSLEFIKNNFSHLIDSKYDKELQNYLRYFILNDISVYVSDIINYGSIQTHFGFRRNVSSYDEKKRMFNCKLNYEYSVKTAIHPNSKWVTNYKNEIGSKDYTGYTSPFDIGDKKNIDFIENLLDSYQNIKIDFIEPDSEKIHTFFVKYSKVDEEIVYDNKSNDDNIEFPKRSYSILNQENSEITNAKYEINQIANKVNDILRDEFWKTVTKKKLIPSKLANEIRFSLDRYIELINKILILDPNWKFYPGRPFDFIYSMTFLVEGKYDEFHNYISNPWNYNLENEGVSLEYSKIYAGVFLRYGLNEMALKHYEYALKYRPTGLVRMVKQLQNKEKVKIPPMHSIPDSCKYIGKAS
jgi:hypothetical protein